MTVAWTSESLGRRGLWYALAALVALAPLTGFAQVRPDRAARPIGDGGGGGGGGGGDTDPPGLDCLSDTSGTISLTPQTVIFGQLDDAALERPHAGRAVEALRSRSTD